MNTDTYVWVVQRVRELRKLNVEKRPFNDLIREAVNELQLTSWDRDKLVHDLAVEFGRRGGNKKPRKQREKSTKSPAQKKKASMKLHRQPLTLGLLHDMWNMARQANEHICPVD